MRSFSVKRQLPIADQFGRTAVFVARVVQASDYQALGNRHLEPSVTSGYSSAPVKLVNGLQLVYDLLRTASQGVSRMTLNNLTYTILELNSLIDKSAHADISEVERQIESGNLFGWVSQQFEGKID